MKSIFENCFIGSIRRWEITSEESGGWYDVFISLPANYGQTDTTYPLLIALDANYCIGTISETAALQAKTGEAQDIIVVGVGTSAPQEHFVRRLRDYTPGVPPDHILQSDLGKMLIDSFRAENLTLEDELGRANAFLGFLQRELLPRLTTEFRIDLEDIGIAGHSAGGAFVSHVLLTRAAPFRKLILASFGTFWYGSALEKYEAAFLESAEAQPIEAYACFGGGEINDPGLSAGMREGIAMLERLAKQDPTLHLKLNIPENESHGSIPAHALSSGIRHLWPGPSYSQALSQYVAEKLPPDSK